MATEWVAGVPWFERALRAAEYRGPDVVQAVTDIARDYRDGRGSFTVTPEVDQITGTTRDRIVRVTRGGFAAVIGEPARIVIGFGIVAPTETSPRPVVGTKAQPRAVGRKTQFRGPRDRDELFAWLTDAGYRIEIADRRHYAVFAPDGARISTVSKTASDHRSLANVTSELRRVTGLPLRKEAR
jgi:hypothetical protein